MDFINNYYQDKSIEDGRLFCDNKHKTEFILTIDYIDKYLKKGMKILELGAGTGAYSLYYAQQGYEVHALEYVKKNLDILKSKIKENMNITPVLGDARDLSMYLDNTFDMTLCLGPMYHLDVKGREKCLEESIRVTKAKGLIYLAYISNNFTFVKCIKKFDNYIEKYKEEIGEDFRLTDSQNVFTFMYPKEMEDLIVKYHLEKVYHVTTDGISSLIMEKINSMPEREFGIWIKYLRATAEREDQLGYGEHLLYIARKKV
jgi:ubiquinone/menaquinone biosynthesis C-methylase UbiE